MLSVDHALELCLCCTLDADVSGNEETCVMQQKQVVVPLASSSQQQQLSMDHTKASPCIC
jgi:hypothetical protein